MNQKKNASSLNFIHLHTQLPLTDLDKTLSEAVSKLKHAVDLPILIFVGVHGNRGYSLDSIPVVVFSTCD